MLSVVFSSFFLWFSWSFRKWLKANRYLKHHVEKNVEHILVAENRQILTWGMSTCKHIPWIRSFFKFIAIAVLRTEKDCIRYKLYAVLHCIYMAASLAKKLKPINMIAAEIKNVNDLENNHFACQSFKPKLSYDKKWQSSLVGQTL